MTTGLFESCDTLRAALVACIGFALLAGCAAVSGVAPTAAPNVGVSAVASLAGVPLLYVSDWATNDVFVYDYSSHASVGRLTGLRGPSGQCVDRKHDVWVTELHGSDVVEFAHGAKNPTRRLRTQGYPIGCAIDITTGNLAVVNFYRNAGSGTIQVWKGAAGTARTYHPTKLYYLWPPAYDDQGDVFVEGRSQDGTSYGVSELPHGGSELRALSLRGATIHYAAAAVWDGARIGLTDQASGGGATTTVYRVALAGTIAKVVGRTQLADGCHGSQSDVAAPFVVRKDGEATRIIGGNLSCANRFNFWYYPGGGTPHTSLHDAPGEPFGESVSPPDSTNRS